MDKSYRMTKNQKWTMASTTTGFAMKSMDMMFLSFAIAPMIKDFHISSAAGGMIGSISNIGLLVGALIFGMLADRFGRVKVFTYTIFIFALATGAMYFAPNIWWVYILRFFVGFGAGGEAGTGITLIAENFSGHKITSLISYAQGLAEIGSMASALISAAILPRLGWHGLFLFGTIPAILAFIVRLNLKENPNFIKNVEVRKAKHRARPPFSKLFSTPKFAYLSLVMIMMYLVDAASYDGIMVWMPSIMQKKMHISISKSSLWMITTIIGVTLGMLAFGKVMDKYGPKMAFTIFFIIAPFSVYSIVLSYNAWTLLAATTIVGFFAEGAYSGYGVIISRLYPMEIRATANNVLQNCGKFIGGFSVVLIGYMMDHTSLLLIIIFLSILPLINLGLLYTIPDLKKV